MATTRTVRKPQKIYVPPQTLPKAKPARPSRFCRKLARQCRKELSEMVEMDVFPWDVD